MTSTAATGTARSLAILGAVLVLLGLLTGFVSGQLANPRMGLASHLEGLMNGTLMRLWLKSLVKSTTFGLLLILKLALFLDFTFHLIETLLKPLLFLMLLRI